MKRFGYWISVVPIIAMVWLLVDHYAWAQSKRDATPADSLLHAFDTDRDDRLSIAEVDSIAATLKPQDLDGDGYLDRNELQQDFRQEANMPRPPQSSGPRRRPPVQRHDLSEQETGTVLFHDGFETDPRDGGRPVGLIAAALGVDDQVFRDAFSSVRPSRNGPPSASRVRDNKAVLLAALRPHGITNDRLDEVSDYYRYRPEAGERWTHRPARARAVIEKGKVIKLELQDPGAGYSSVPRIEIVGFPDLQVTATVIYGKDLRTNGRIGTLTIE